MKRCNIIQIAIIFVLTICLNESIIAQVTTSSISGKVTDMDGIVLIGATVKAVHEPSQSVYGTNTNSEGFYRISNLRVGGPYTITITYTGYSTLEIKELSLRLGEQERFDVKLNESSVSTEPIIVTAKQGSAGQNMGTSTNIGVDDINNLPTISRSINDFIRLTPQSAGYGGGVTIGGVNNRFNAIYIDGAINNDVFGLASSGTNGGQTGISPFSLDILDQLQVVLSPYDVSMSGFAGGGINAVTRSGTNEFKATAYNYFKNQNTYGKDNGVLAERLDIERARVNDFIERQYGFSVSGPIIKNKLFFFVNTELQADETPVPFNANEYTGVDGRVSTNDLDNLRNHLINTYNYDPGSYGNTSRNLEGTKFFGKINYTINNNHNLVFRHQYTIAEQFNRNAGNRNLINFSNNGIYFPSTTNSSALEFNSIFGESYSNNLILSYVRVRDNRSTLGDRFPYVRIDDEANGSIQFGSEQFSTANQLNQDILTLTNNFRIYKKNHTYTIGTHNEFYSIYNLFLRQNFGYYRYASLDDFINGGLPTQFQRTYALPGADDGAADFNAMQFGIYGQDEWRVNDKLSLSLGLRLDLPVILDNPREDNYFNETALPEIQKYYDLANDTKAGQAPSPQLMFSPRVGFSYILDEKSKQQLRGGAGVFTSRIPFVWPGAMFTNNGLTAGSVDLRAGRDEMIPFNPNPDTQITDPNFSVPSGQMDLFTDGFRYPQVFRTNIAYDFILPFDIQTTVESFYTKTLNNILYTNINSDPTVKHNLTGGPDNRPVYVNQSIDNTYTAAYLASNTSQGYTYNFSLNLAKDFDFGLKASVAYAWTDAFALSEGTSSQNSSQWRGQVHVNGRNNPEFGRSDFAIGHRVVTALSYTKNWTKNKLFGTTISLFINSQSGVPYSYVIGGPFAAQNLSGETGSVSANRGLVYIPGSENDINLVDYQAGDVTVTAAEQWQRLNNFIEDDKYLSKNRGQYAEKNGSFAPFTNLIDFSIRQDIGLKIGNQTHRFQISADIFNLGNLLYEKWGTVYTVRGNFNNYYLYTFEGYEADGTTPKYTFREDNIGLDKFNINPIESRWRMQLGIRYLFN